MLLSFSHKFLFIANLKSASSAIEGALGNLSEIRITDTRFGKHDILSEISQKYTWARRYVRYDQFFVFGVIRDPVDYLLSLYNSHHKSAFDGMFQSTKNMSPDEFFDVWCGRSWQAKPQHLRFTDSHKRFHLSYLIDYDNLEEQFAQVCAHLGLGKVRLGRWNPSPSVLTRADLTKAHLEWISTRYKDDYEFIKNRPAFPGS